MEKGVLKLAVVVGLSLSFSVGDAFAFPKQSRNCSGKITIERDGRYFCTVTCFPKGTGSNGGPVSPRPNTLAEAQKICEQFVHRATSSQPPSGNTGGSMPVPPMPNSPPRTGGTMPVPPMPHSPAMMP